MNPILPTRLKARSPGLGQANQTDIDSRAIEIAHSDGRTKVNDTDIQQASEELAKGSASSMSLDEQAKTEELTAWDDPLDQSGHRVTRCTNEGEQTIAEQLIQDGIEEAEHDIRTAASETPPA